MTSTIVRVGRHRFMLEMEEGKEPVAYYYKDGRKSFKAGEHTTERAVKMYNERSKQK